MLVDVMGILHVMCWCVVFVRVFIFFSCLFFCLFRSDFLMFFICAVLTVLRFICYSCIIYVLSFSFVFVFVFVCFSFLLFVPERLSNSCAVVGAVLDLWCIPLVLCLCVFFCFLPCLFWCGCLPCVFLSVVCSSLPYKQHWSLFTSRLTSLLSLLITNLSLLIQTALVSLHDQIHPYS